jgi:hypothetical protein
MNMRSVEEHTVMPVAPAPAAGTRLKNARHERFARLCLEFTQAEAWRRAIGNDLRATPRSVIENASRLAARPEIARRIAELRVVAQQIVAVDVSERVQELRDIESADASELQYHPACRHCFGHEFKYQWVDANEYADAVDAAAAEQTPLPSPDGGFGYDGSLHPNPSCARCFGAGAPHLYTVDVTRLSGKARRLFKGFGKNGELLMHDAMLARAQLSRMLGQDGSDPAAIARAAAAGAAVGAAAGVAFAELSPAERQRAYSRIIEG